MNKKRTSKKSAAAFNKGMQDIIDEGNKKWQERTKLDVAALVAMVDAAKAKEEPIQPETRTITMPRRLMM